MMPITDLLPWRRTESRDLAESGESADSLQAFEQRMNRLFDEFFGRSAMTPSLLDESWSAFSPRVDIVERDEELEISAELPGLDREDIDVSLSDDLLTISGEKRVEREEEKGSVYRTERSYGSFRRQVALPCEIEADQVKANFRNGVLTVTLPKVCAEEARKRIAVKSD
jgi:HSP20 family protein